MPRKEISEDRKAAFLALLDDENPIVRQALTEELRELGEGGVAWLKQTTLSENPEHASAAREVLPQVAGPNPVGQFLEYIQGEDYDLEIGFHLLDQVVLNEADWDEQEKTLREMAGRCRELLMAHMKPWDQCKVLNRVIFHDFGFRGNVEQFDDPYNSVLHAVVRRRKGIPITLASLYLLVARRCGIQLEPVGMPGRFMVGCFLEDVPFFIDVFERGAFRSEAELMEIMRNNNFPPHPDILAPTPVGEVLCRNCRNLARQYALLNRSAKSKQFVNFVKEFEAVHRRQVEP